MLYFHVLHIINLLKMNLASGNWWLEAYIGPGAMLVSSKVTCKKTNNYCKTKQGTMSWGMVGSAEIMRCFVSSGMSSIPSKCCTTLLSSLNAASWSGNPAAFLCRWIQKNLSRWVATQARYKQCQNDRPFAWTGIHTLVGSRRGMLNGSKNSVVARTAKSTIAFQIANFYFRDSGN